MINEEYQFGLKIDEDSIENDEKILKMAMNNNNKKFRSLFEGIVNDYNSESAAYLAFCSILAYYTKDSEQIDRIFRRSKLLTPRWDEQRGEQTYGEIIIQKATDFVISKKEDDLKKLKSGENIDHLPKMLKQTDLHNSEIFISIFGNSLRYCKDFKKWFHWDNITWSAIPQERVLAFSEIAVKYIYQSADLEEDEEDKSRMRIWAKETAAIARRKAMVEGAQGKLIISSSLLDAKPDLFNCLNGTYNLKKQSFHPHNREDFLTKMSGVNYDPKAECSSWLGHLSLIFNDDAELISAFQELMGYGLLEGNPEEIFVFFYGAGKTGKSKTVFTIDKIFGDYGKTLPFSTFINRSSSSIRNDIASLIGVRFVVASESSEDDEFNTALLKQLTGGDKISARFLYGEFFEFTPACLLVLATNYKPIVKDWDSAFERRLWAIPFTVEIPEEKRDTHIIEKFTLEIPGIFNWMIEGLQRYHERQRLCDQPMQVKIACEEYRKEMNQVGVFLDTFMEVCPRNNSIEWLILRKDLYDAYIQWCKLNNEEAVSTAKFARELKKRGVSDGGYRLDRKKLCWAGVKTKSDLEQSIINELFKERRLAEAMKGINNF